MKQCAQCRQQLDLAQFSKRSASKDGLHPYCRLCANERLRAAYHANREVVSNQRREHYQANREHLLVARAEYQRANRDRINAQRRRRREVDPAAVGEIERRRKLARRRRLVVWDAELSALVDSEAADLRLRRARSTGIEWHVDHVVPLKNPSVSGLHTPHNLAVVPWIYNSRKTNRWDGEPECAWGWL